MSWLSHSILARDCCIATTKRYSVILETEKLSAVLVAKFIRIATIGNSCMTGEIVGCAIDDSPFGSTSYGIFMRQFRLILSARRSV
jgi:hypothetical protein